MVERSNSHAEYHPLHNGYVQLSKMAWFPVVLLKEQKKRECVIYSIVCIKYSVKIDIDSTEQTIPKSDSCAIVCIKEWSHKANHYEQQQNVSMGTFVYRIRIENV